MIRSPLERRREDETPISPSPSSPVPEIFSTKKIFFLNSSYSGSRHSEIPHVESDYCPRDETSRRLFVQSEEFCDCDCSSDGCWGCLRRNKKCLCKIFVFVLLLLILGLLFASLTYSFFGNKESPDPLESNLNNKWPSHDHSYSSEQEQFPNNRKEEEVENNLFEDDYSISDDYNLNDNAKTHYYEQGYGDKKKFPQEIIPYFTSDLNMAYDDFENNVRTIPDNREPSKKKRSVPSKRKNEEVFLDDMNYDEKRKPFALLKFQERMNWDRLEQKRKFQDHFLRRGKTVFHPFSLTTPMSSTHIESEDYIESNSIEDENSKLPLQLKIDIDSQHFAGGTEKGELPPSEIENNSLGESFFKVKNDTPILTSFFLGPDSKSLEAEEEIFIEKGTTISSILSFGKQKLSEETKSDGTTIFPKLSLIDFSEKAKLDDNFFFDRIAASNMQLPEKSLPLYFDAIEGINLEEARKRMKQSRKHLLLNSRVVAGSPDVTLPTGPDIGKPISNSLETMKINQQYSLTPSAASQFIFPYQICLFANPHLGPKPSIRSAQTRTFSLQSPFLISPPVSKDDSDKHSSHFPSQQNFLSFSVNNYANPPPRQQAPYPSFSSSSFNSPFQHQQFPQYMNYAPPPNTQPIFCTYIQPPLFQFPSVSGTSDFRQSDCYDCEENMAYHPISIEEKIKTSDQINFCSGDSVSCKDGSACIPTSNWCDNEVHCQDVSDEEFCSCRDRVALERLCDGYMDCPHGEDEVGCFDCPKSAFNCAGIIGPDSCIPLSKKCDGVRDCEAGTDETDCAALFFNIDQRDSYKASHIKGFLHRNWKGTWYPVCVDLKNDEWGKEACLAEVGYSSQVEVLFHSVPENYNGQFLVRDENGKVTVQNHCKGHYSTYIKCPEIKCGTRAEFYSLQEFENRFKRFSTNDTQEKNGGSSNATPKFLNNTLKFVKENIRTKKETGRVVGGKESEPRAWPWAVAVFEDGTFHCGGVILDEKWILSAAHCVDGYWKHFYEVRAGMLRRFSFSAMEQVRRVGDIIVHENYNPTIMSNDIALLRLREPFHLNRWIRPACLPSLRGNIFEAILGPHPGTSCTAIGWGAMRERGKDADQLREVEVPILKQCKHTEDLVGAEICAGQKEGGKDTCQGDSGGPLLCRDSKTPASWYIAGIVSHGEGCARPGEPGAYTRIGLFVNWITTNSNDFMLPSIKPLPFCPGFRCKSGTKLCIPKKWVCNGYTDCLLAEDEKNCTSTRISSDSFYKIYSTDLKSVKSEQKGKTTKGSDEIDWDDSKYKNVSGIFEMQTGKNSGFSENIDFKGKNNEDISSDIDKIAKLFPVDEKIATEKISTKNENLFLSSPVNEKIATDKMSARNEDMFISTPVSEKIAIGKISTKNGNLFLSTPVSEEIAIGEISTKNEDMLLSSPVNEKITTEKISSKSEDIFLSESPTTPFFSSYSQVIGEKIFKYEGSSKSSSSDISTVSNFPSFSSLIFQSSHSFHGNRELDNPTEATLYSEVEHAPAVKQGIRETTSGEHNFDDIYYLKATDDVPQVTDYERKIFWADKLSDMESTQSSITVQVAESDTPAFDIEDFSNDSPVLKTPSSIEVSENENTFDQDTETYSKKNTEIIYKSEPLNPTPTYYTSGFSPDAFAKKTSKKFTTKSVVTDYDFLQTTLTSDSVITNSLVDKIIIGPTLSSTIGISYNSSEYFQCRTIVQSILKSFHCDGVLDCEDGSDEDNCTCAEIVMKQSPRQICNGQIDCSDSTDEKNCRERPVKNLSSQTNKACLPAFMKYKVDDSNSKENECFLLAEKGKVSSDDNGEPLLQRNGLIMRRKNNEVTTVCQENESVEGGLVSAICLDLGYVGYDKYKNKTISKNCTGLLVTCSKSLISSTKFYRTLKGNYFWPWNAVIFADGKAICSGVLLFPQWILTSQYCFHNISVEQSYIAAKLGARSLLKEPRDFGSQFLRIDAFHFLPNSDLTLLHLQAKANETWHVRPIGIPYVIDSDPERDVCVPLGDRNLFLKFSEDCSLNSLCYNRTFPQPMGCTSKSWTGVIVCQSRFGWYPSSTFSEKEGHCGFVNSRFNNVADHHKKIFSVTEKKIVSVPEPFCRGFRCPDGLCISSEKVCDGNFDCVSRKDESLDACTKKYKQCSRKQLKCNNGKCISKVLFGDGKDDCGDGSDEPANATCLEYLRLTAPQKICNGKRNCLDKTDENYHLCKCTSNKFKCKLSHYCIPNDFVCDGEKDCPDGEDENICSGGKTVKNSKTQIVEVVKKSYGMWHTICPTNLSKEQSDAFCRYLGFDQASSFYEKKQTVILPRLDPFSVVKLNSWTSIAIRNDRPFVKLIKTRRLCSVVKCI